MAATANSWMPASGKHSVSIGKSLGRALKARKGVASAAPKGGIPDKDFYSFRYNFKPESIDSTKPGSIEIKTGRDSTTVTVERSSSQVGEFHVFNGAQQPAKEWECVLIYDEELGTFTLEKMDSFVILNHDRKKTVNHMSSSASPLPPVPSSSTPKGSHDLDYNTNREPAFGSDDDADGEPDDLEEIISGSTFQLRQEEEESVNMTNSRRHPKSRTSKPVKSRSRSPDVPLAAKVKAKGKGKPKRQRESDADEEEMSFGRPSKQTKRQRHYPQPEGLALPSDQSSLTFPPAPLKSAGLPVSASNPSSPRFVLDGASDSEEEWDEVAAPPATDPITVDGAEGGGDGSEEEEIDMNAFEAEMNQELGVSEDDFLAAAVSSEPETAPSGRPMSLHQFAGGADPSQDEDDYSSSDESDED